jgi:hypothetical protein
MATVTRHCQTLRLLRECRLRSIRCPSSCRSSWQVSESPSPTFIRWGRKLTSKTRSILKICRPCPVKRGSRGVTKKYNNLVFKMTLPVKLSQDMDILNIPMKQFFYKNGLVFTKQLAIFTSSLFK